MPAGTTWAPPVVLGALLAEGLAWPLYVRAAGYAGVAFGATGRAGLAAVALAVPRRFARRRRCRRGP